MTLLDAYALLALLLDEPAAGEVEDLIRAGDSSICVVNLAEVVDFLRRRQGRSAEAVSEVVGPLVAETLESRGVDTAMAWRAAEIRARHYQRRVSELSLADCFLLASALEGEAIATADPALARAARHEGIEVHALPGNDGSRP